ncbi:hypothetical protein Cni_G29216 [Canna indica]|uniref:cytidine deaminase n=1 Tax=Canna indica TaxID=4628 RepID=A0AAQ3L8Q3_9LILI|nr:hypothetical protein Cni_G29216 [Canna indica]
MAGKPARSTGGRFVIEAEEVKAMAKEAGVSAVRDLLPLLVPDAKRLARPPISHYHVAAVGLGARGRIYVGVNLEFPGLPLNHSVHAEQFLVANAAAHGESSILCFAVSSFPCGHCRQFLQEIRGAEEIEILVTADADPAFRPLASLLPHHFGPYDLLHKGAPRLLEPHHNELGAVEAAKDNGTAGERLERRLREAAEGAARASHAPYSGCPSGLAVADGRGRVYAGSYVESAAYNPSLGPVQAAMIACLAVGGGEGESESGEYWDVAEAVLVEKEAAAVSQEATARIFLEAVAPSAHLKVYRFRSSAIV